MQGRKAAAEGGEERWDSKAEPRTHRWRIPEPGSVLPMGVLEHWREVGLSSC